MSETPRDASVLDLVVTIWRAKVLVVCGAVLGALAGWGCGNLLPSRYTATVMVAPAETGASGNLGGLASQFGGLASLAGISVEGDKKPELMAILQSDLLTSRYIEKNALLKMLYADKWDESLGSWRDSRPAHHPTLWSGTRLFKKRIGKISEDRKSGLITLTIDWTDPVRAAGWANGLVQMADDYLRDRALTESSNNIAYLNAEAAKTNVVEAQRAIYSLLEVETNKQMMAKGRVEYALRVIDPAVVPERPSSMSVPVAICLGFLVGLVLASMLALVRSMFVR